MGSKIYTKTGDKGQTSLLGGTRLPKHHIRIEAYGNVDELNSWMGLLRDELPEKCDLIIKVQEDLFCIGSHLANDPENPAGFKLPEVKEEDILLLEKEIDSLTSVLPEMRSFILPGGNTHVSHCHIARCVCRRAERSVVKLSEAETVDQIHIKYLNRLSDLLFILARWVNKERKSEEKPWKPRAS